MSSSTPEVWRPEDTVPPVPETPGSEIFRPDILDEIEKKIEAMSKELNALSLDIHGKHESQPVHKNPNKTLFYLYQDHPELKYEEVYATHQIYFTHSLPIHTIFDQQTNS